MNSLTKGPIVKTILRLAIPIMASSFLGTLYNLCDMAWVGTLGAKTVAGVGAGGMYLWLSSGLATLPRMGGQVLVAQAIGAGDYQRAHSLTRAAMQIVFALGLVFSIISLLFTRQMVGFFNLTDGESVAVAHRYIQITCGLILFSFLNMTLTGLYTADGDSKTPMIANFFGLVLNMILDPLLILGPGFFPRLEDVGAAVATVFSQAIVFGILLLKMRGRESASGIFRQQHYFTTCSKEIYAGIVRIGVPAAIQSMVYCFISMLITRLVSGFGPEAVAVSRVGGQIESISWNTAEGFSSAINSFCGQNYGAGEYDRIKKGYLFSLGACFLWGTAVLLCFVLFPAPISMIFFHEEAAIACSISYLIIIGFCEPFLMVEIVTEGALSGLGKTKLCSIISVILTAMRIPLAYLFMRTALGLNGIWFALTLTSVLKGIIYMGTFFVVRPGK